jgi:ABC-type multidrug transport system fused ATPase/permease subunit
VLFALAIVTILGPSLATIIFIITIFNVPVYARIVRTQTLSLRETEFILAERSLGAESWRVLFVHMLPNVIGPLLILVSMDVPVVITIEAGSVSSALACAANRQLGEHPQRRLRLHPQYAVDGDCRRRAPDPGDPWLHLPRRISLRDAFDPRCAGMSEPSPTILQISDSSVAYATPRGAVRALAHVDLTVPRGEIVGIVGESGCGKTTLISRLMRLLAGNATGLRAAASCFNGRRRAGNERHGAPPASRRRHRHGVPGPDDGAQPGTVDRHANGRCAVSRTQIHPPRNAAPPPRMLKAGRHPGCGKPAG